MLERRSRTFRNRARMNLLLELIRIHLDRQDDPRVYATRTAATSSPATADPSAAAPSTTREAPTRCACDRTTKHRHPGWGWRCLLGHAVSRSLPFGAV